MVARRIGPPYVSRYHHTVAFDTPWDLDAVWPHPFPVPCSVVFGARVPEARRRALSADTTKWSGSLPARNVDWLTVADLLEQSPGKTMVAAGDHASPYAKRFESGAKLKRLASATPTLRR